MLLDDSEILDAVIRALERAESDDYVDAYRAGERSSFEHQFLFFIKPEVFDGDEREIEARLGIILERLSLHSVRIERALVVNGRYLERHRVVSEHYGVIDRIAHDPREALPETGRVVFLREFGMDIDSARIAGAFEYLRRHDELTPDTLSKAWLERGFTKLGGGCYCQYISGEDVYLFNGFYPKLLTHYTRSNARIAIFVVSGALDWSTARREMIGSTNPRDALEGSVRRLLLESAAELGFSEISANLNGVHLSAGPVEALVELLRFTENRHVSKPNTSADEAEGAENDTQRLDERYRQFNFGYCLEETFEPQEIESILGNPDVVVDGATSSIFDLTEEINPPEAIRILQNVREQLPMARIIDSGR